MEKLEGPSWELLLTLLLNVVVLILHTCKCIGGDVYLWANFSSITHVNNSDAQSCALPQSVCIWIVLCVDLMPYSLFSFGTISITTFLHWFSIMFILVFSHCLAAHKYVGLRISIRTVLQVDVLCCSSSLISDRSSHPFYIPFIDYFSKP